VGRPLDDPAAARRYNNKDMFFAVRLWLAANLVFVFGGDAVMRCLCFVVALMATAFSGNSVWAQTIGGQNPSGRRSIPT
jgi:hypothetical protein